MIYLFYGDNTYAAKQQLEKLIERYKNSTGSDFGLQRFSHESVPDQVIGALSSQPMFAESSLVVLENPSYNRELIDRLNQNLERVPESTVLVILDPYIDARTKWFKNLKSQARLKEFKPKAEPQLLAWVIDISKASGLDMDKPTARLLIDRAGTDQWRLHKEVEKLSINGELTQEAIHKLVAPNPDNTVFELLDALAAGQQRRALQHYDDLKSQNIHELEILAIMGWQLRNLMVLAESENRSDQDIAKDHGINPYVIRKTKPLARRLRSDDLISLYRQIAETDYEIKTGRAANPDASVEKLILRIGNLSENKH